MRFNDILMVAAQEGARTAPGGGGATEVFPTFTTDAPGGEIIAGGYTGTGMSDGVFDSGSTAWAVGIASASLTGDLGSAQTIAEIWITPYTEGAWGASNMDGLVLEHSTDGSSWTTITTISGSVDDVYSKYYPSVSARYVRVRMTDNYKAVGDFRVFV